MMKILFPLMLILICFTLHPILGCVALGVLLVRLFLNLMPDMYALKANKHYIKGDAQSAVKLYKKAVSTKRASDKVKLQYAVALLKQGFAEDAEGVFDGIIVSQKADKKLKLTAKTYRAMAYSKQGKMQDAREDAQEVFDLMKNSMSYSLLGYVMHAMNAPVEELLAFCEEGYEYNSDDRDICDNYLLALFKNGELEKAREIGNKLIADNPTFIEGYFHTAMCENALGNKKEAKHLLEKIADCKRVYLTTVSEEEVAELLREVQNA